MIKKILHTFTFLFVCCATLACADAPQLSMQEKFAQSKDGDFIVTSQDGNYSLLFVRLITADTLLLEEIAVPEKQIDLKTVDWKKWTADKAPGHTSWTLYEIDRKSGQLLECFSYSKNAWLYFEESEQFLTKLISLSLNRVPDKERKKIGPQPASGESDTRAPWNPPLVVEGKKIDKAAFEVWRTRWPADGSRLSLCMIELYFAKQNPNFPFPYWLEIQSPHYMFKMRAVDSGHSLVSAMQGPMPHRSPKFLGMSQKGNESWKLQIRTPPYHQKINLFVIDLSGESKATIPVPFTSRAMPRQEMTLEIATSDLNKILEADHRYQWVMIPEGSSNIYVESEEVFIWKL